MRQLLFLAEGSVLVGGQAVIEGVLMRLPETYAVAVRTPSGEVRVKRERLPETARGRFGNLPFIRGSFILFKAMILGFKALQFSADTAAEAEEAQDEEETESKTGAVSSWAMGLTLLLSLAAGVAVFFYVPLLLTQFLSKYSSFAAHTIGFNVVDGLIRIILFLGYITAISAMKDIRRVFAYHGAEHKTVHAWETGEPLSVELAKKQSRLHPRCGTSFLLFVMVVSILVFSIVPASFPLWVKIASRVIFLPLIAGISYELIRLTAKHPRSWWSRPLLWPGLGLQLMTTRVPDDDMLTVAIRAIDEARDLAAEQVVT